MKKIKKLIKIAEIAIGSGGELPKKKSQSDLSSKIKALYNLR